MGKGHVLIMARIRTGRAAIAQVGGCRSLTSIELGAPNRRSGSTVAPLFSGAMSAYARTNRAARNGPGVFLPGREPVLVLLVEFQPEDRSTP